MSQRWTSQNSDCLFGTLVQHCSYSAWGEKNMSCTLQCGEESSYTWYSVQAMPIYEQHMSYMFICSKEISNTWFTWYSVSVMFMHVWNMSYIYVTVRSAQTLTGTSVQSMQLYGGCQLLELSLMNLNHVIIVIAALLQLSRAVAIKWTEEEMRRTEDGLKLSHTKSKILEKFIW